MSLVGEGPLQRHRRHADHDGRGRLVGADKLDRAANVLQVFLVAGQVHAGLVAPAGTAIGRLLAGDEAAAPVHEDLRHAEGEDEGRGGREARAHVLQQRRQRLCEKLRCPAEDEAAVGILVGRRGKGEQALQPAIHHPEILRRHLKFAQHLLQLLEHGEGVVEIQVRPGRQFVHPHVPGVETQVAVPWHAGQVARAQCDAEFLREAAAHGEEDVATGEDPARAERDPSGPVEGLEAPVRFRRGHEPVAVVGRCLRVQCRLQPWNRHGVSRQLVRKPASAARNACGFSACSQCPALMVSDRTPGNRRWNSGQCSGFT